MTINLGNLSNSLQKIGQGMMENVNFYARSKMALHNSCGCCWGGGSSIWSGYGTYGGNCGYPGGYSTCDNYTLNTAYMQGAQLFNYYLAQHTGSTAGVQDNDNAAADAVSSDTDTTLGQAFDTSANSGAEFGFATSIASETDAAKKQQIYSQNTEEVGKSFLMYMDKTSGNSDGYISLEEFVSHETKNMSETDKAQRLSFIQQAFSALDQNGDGKVDYKELSAMVGAYDADNNGSISGNEFETGGQSLLSGSFTQNLRTAYQKLYGSSTTTE